VPSKPDKRSKGTRKADNGRRRPRKGDYLQ
jgi:hypothetical protein